MELKELDELNERRREIRPLLSPVEPLDAVTSYYALWHDPRRTELFIHRDSRHLVDAFLTVSQTGVDLFRPLVTLFAQDSRAVGELLHNALTPERPYRLIVPLDLASEVREHLEFSRSSTNRIYRLDPSRFQAVVNVLVQRAVSADGSARYQIESQGQLVAMSGTNWRSPAFAEVFVYVHPKGRGRGWGKSVVSACTAGLLEERRRPLYMVREGNQASITLAEGLGYVDTGARELAGECQLK